MTKQTLIQLNPQQSTRLFDLVDLCSKATTFGKYESRIDSMGLIEGTPFHWYQVCLDYLPKILFGRLYFRRDRINARGIELNMLHPVDAVYEQYNEAYKKKGSTLSPEEYNNFRFMSINDSQEQKILEMMDYCSKIRPIVKNVDMLNFESGFLKGTKFHWFQLVYDYMMHVILENDWKWQSNMCRVTLNSFIHNPVEYLYDKYQRKINKISFYDNTTHDFVRENQEREDRRIEREKEKKAQKKK